MERFSQPEERELIAQIPIVQLTHEQLENAKLDQQDIDTINKRLQELKLDKVKTNPGHVDVSKMQLLIQEYLQKKILRLWKWEELRKCPDDIIYQNEIVLYLTRRLQLLPLKLQEVDFNLA